MSLPMGWNRLGENTPVCGPSQPRKALEPDVLPEHWGEMTGPALPAVASPLGNSVSRSPGWRAHGADSDSVGDKNSFGFWMLI